ncbi:phage integrase N-terminal SAM-like domain-containing protein [Oceanobacter antarcticus]|uniref:phage integrase N-terminal SAM-like domain-containing protein n=1 Tax=Oceanobacter antarcticus TaxID=3133425 RepID=UPI003A0FDA68
MSKSPFLNQISRFMRLNGYSLRTEKTYLYWIKAYIRFHQRQHPNAMGLLRSWVFWITWRLTNRCHRQHES